MIVPDELTERLTRFYREVSTEVRSSPPAWEASQRPRVRWLRPVLASIALAALAVTLGVALRMARHEANRTLVTSSPSPSIAPSPSPSASTTSSWVASRVPLGEVSGMALDGAAVFALYTPASGNGAVNPEQTMLARIDRVSGAAITAGPFPGAMRIARVQGGLWLGGSYGQGTSGTDTQWLYRVDPTTLAVRNRIHLPRQQASGSYPVAQLAGTSSLLWMGYGNQLYRLNPDTGVTMLTRSLPGTATSISIDPPGRRLYVGVDVPPSKNSQDMVIEWDASTGARLASASTGGLGLGGPQVAAAADGVWIAYATGMLGEVDHLSADGLASLAVVAHMHTNGIRVFVLGGILWLVDAMAQQVACADPRDGTIRASTQESLPAVVAADAAGSYLGAADGVDVLRPDPSCLH